MDPQFLKITKEKKNISKELVWGLVRKGVRDKES